MSDHRQRIRQGRINARELPKERIDELRRQGMTDVAIAREFGVSRRSIIYRAGPRRPKGEIVGADIPYTVMLRPGDLEKLREVAEEKELFSLAGPNAGKGSVSAVLHALADRKLHLDY